MMRWAIGIAWLLSGAAACIVQVNDMEELTVGMLPFAIFAAGLGPILLLIVLLSKYENRVLWRRNSHLPDGRREP